jgi:TIGR03009 family protein
MRMLRMTNFLRCLTIVLAVLASSGDVALAQLQQQPQQQQLQQPPEFQLNAVQQAYLDQVLSSWQNESAKVTIFQCPFERWEYNQAFGPGPNIPLNKNKGELSYQKPDKGSFEVSEVRVWDVTANDWVVKKDAIGEHWVCDGQNVYEYRSDQKQLVVRPIPPQMQGKAIVDGPLPFLFGAEAGKLKARYFMRADQPQNPNEILITTRPRFAPDAADYRQVDVILDRAQMMPKAMQVHMPNGDRHVYMFDIANAKVNETLQKIMALFGAPSTPWGWKKVVEVMPADPSVPVPGRQAAQPDGAAPR